MYTFRKQDTLDIFFMFLYDIFKGILALSREIIVYVDKTICTYESY
jgi:hypothetical protein